MAARSPRPCLLLGTRASIFPAVASRGACLAGFVMVYTASMKMTVDLALIIGMAICYAAGQFVAAGAFSAIAMGLLLVFVIRLCGGAITWIVTER